MLRLQRRETCFKALNVGNRLLRRRSYIAQRAGQRFVINLQS